MGTRIVLIGAGSRSFGRGQIVDFLSAEDLQGRDVTLVLVDQDPERLLVMTRLAERIREHLGSDMGLESTTDREEALPGAHFVIVAVARKRFELWEQDFRIPVAYGFPQAFGENGGPGALFHALRSLHLVIPICRDAERLCPGALLLNFTNPEARVLHGISRLTKVRAAGLCHGVFSALELIEDTLERRLDELDVVSAGINHLYCILQVRDRKTGEDLLPELMRRTLAAPLESQPPLFRKLAEVFGVFTFPSDHHIGEYFAWGTEYSGTKWHFGRESRPVFPGPEPPRYLPLEEYASGERPMDEEVLKPSVEVAAPMVCDIVLGRERERPAVNVLNAERYIENLPETGVVEVPAVVDGDGIHPKRVGPLPEPFASFLRTQISIHELVTRAYAERSRKLLLQALLLDPVVNGIGRAEKMLDEMLEMQREYLPEFG